MVQERVDEREIKSPMQRPQAKSNTDSHVQAVRNIAEQLFPYPTPEYPHLRTLVNEPEVEQRVFTNFGHELTPDIVVLQWPEKIPVMIAEVVTPDMLSAELASDTWTVESRLEGVQFFLYVPAGHAADAKKLLKKAKLKNVSLRTWRNNAGLRTVDVAALR